MSYDKEKIGKLSEEIFDYSEADGSETGDVIKHMIGVLAFPDYVSEEYLNATIKELEDTLKHMKEEFVYKTRTVTPAPYTVTELVLKDWYEYD